MKAPLTIIVPVYNRAHYIVRTLDSIAASTCMFSELLIVDNGSDDNTMEVCSQWADSHQDLSVCILSEKKRGVAAARNYGLLSCHSEYVYFFDSDDLFSRDFIASIYPELSQPFDVLCVPVCQNVNSVVRIRPYKACAGVHIHLLNNMLSTQSMVFRKSFLDQIGGWNESLTTWDDWELGTRVLLAHPRLRWYEGQAFHQVFVHQDSLTGESFSATLPAIIKAMQSVLHLIVHAKLTDDERKRARILLRRRHRVSPGAGAGRDL